MKAFAKIALISTCITFSLSATDSINIASEVSYPPWNDTNKEGKFVGFEVDLFPLICKKADLKCAFNGQSFSTIIPSIRFNKYDVIMSGMMITPNRMRVINFSRPYGRMPAVFAVKKGKSLAFCKGCKKQLDLDKTSDNSALLNAIESLKGKKIGVQKNSINHIYITENKLLARKLNLLTTETSGELVELLEKGKIDIAFNTKTFMIDAIKNSRNISIVGPDISGGLIGRGVGIGVRKADAELKARLDKAIAELEDEGVISELSQKWFGFDMFPN